MRILITAGNTRERIDEVRDWGNIFTGNTGYAIARACSASGQVDLLTSNQQHIDEVSSGDLKDRIHAERFHTHADLRAMLALKTAEHAYDAIFMTAAVADYRPTRVYEVLEREARDSKEGVETWVVRDVHSGKVKSHHKTIAVLGEQTEKLVDLFRTEWKHRGLLIKFKLEVGISESDLLTVGERSRLVSGADYLVANTLDMVAGPAAGAFLLSDRGSEFVKRDDLPARLAAILPISR